MFSRLRPVYKNGLGWISAEGVPAGKVEGPEGSASAVGGADVDRGHGGQSAALDLVKDRALTVGLGAGLRVDGRADGTGRHRLGGRLQGLDDGHNHRQHADDVETARRHILTRKPAFDDGALEIASIGARLHRTNRAEEVDPVYER